MSIFSVAVDLVKSGAKVFKSSKTAKEAVEGAAKLTEHSVKPVTELTKGAATGISKTTKEATQSVAKAESKAVSRVDVYNQVQQSKAAVKERLAQNYLGRLGKNQANFTFDHSTGLFYPKHYKGTGSTIFYNFKDFNNFTSRYGKMYGTTAKSGYLSWEKSLPKSQWVGFNKVIPKTPEFAKPLTQVSEKAAITAEKAGKKAGAAVEGVTKNPYVKPSVTIKATQQAGKVEKEVARAETAAASRTAGKSTERVAKDVGERAGITKQQLYADAKKGLYGLGKTAVKGSGKIADAAISHPGALLGWYMFLKLQNRGIVDKTIGEFEKGGVANVMMGSAFGNNAEAVKDTVSNAVSGVVGEGVDIYQGVKGTVTSVADEFGNVYDFTKNKITGYNGMVNDGNGQYADPTVQQYQAIQDYLQQNPDAARLVQEHPELANMYLQQQNQMGGGGMSQALGNIASGAMSGVNSLMSPFTGGNVQKMDVASLLLSGLLFFGRFGILGKLASAAMAGMTLKNVNGRGNAMGMQPQANYQQQLNAYFRQAQQAQQQSEQEVKEEETPSVFRARM